MKYLLPVFIACILAGCADPLPDSKNDYVGLWQNNETSLLITKAGRIEYETNKESVKTSISMPIKSITNSELIAGFLFINSSFELSGPPELKDGLTTFSVDGDVLYKIGNDGKAIILLETPKLDEIRKLVTNDLNLLSDAITNENFSKYISASSIQFQSGFTNEKLVEMYQPFITQNLNLKKWMAGDFILTSEPSIGDEGALVVSGKYPTSPHSLKFSLSFVFSGNTWKSLGPHIAINDE